MKQILFRMDSLMKNIDRFKIPVITKRRITPSTLHFNKKYVFICEDILRCEFNEEIVTVTNLKPDPYYDDCIARTIPFSHKGFKEFLSFIDDNKNRISTEEICDISTTTSDEISLNFWKNDISNHLWIGSKNPKLSIGIPINEVFQINTKILHMLTNRYVTDEQQDTAMVVEDYGNSSNDEHLDKKKGETENQN